MGGVIMIFGSRRKEDDHHGGIWRMRHRKRDRNHKSLSEWFSKLVMMAGLAITYKGLKGWLRSKKRRIRH